MKLNIGCGEKKLNGYKNIDCRKECNPDICDFIQNIKTFDGERIEEIYASHIIEHIPHEDVPIIFERMHSWLKHGDKMFISVPDLKMISWLICGGYYDHVLMNFLYGDSREGMTHCWGYTENSLVKEVEKYSFKSLGKFEPFHNDDSGFVYKGYPLSLNMLFERL